MTPPPDPSGPPPPLFTLARAQRLAVVLAVLVAVAIVLRIASGEMPCFTAWIQAQGGWAPLAYLAGYVVLNYALGITTIRFVDYLFASISMLPSAFLYVYYGKLIGDVAALAAGAPVPRNWVSWTATVLGLLATIAVSIMLARLATRTLRLASLQAPSAAPASDA